MRRVLALGLLALVALVPGAAWAQGAKATAAPPAYTEGALAPLSMDLHGALRNGLTLGGVDVTLGQKTMGASVPVVIASDQTLSLSATIGGFHPTAAGTPITATTGGVSGTLPAGSEVVATNVGTTNGAYCALGGSTSTSWQYIAPNGGWFGFGISGETQLTCRSVAGTTTINMVGGDGLPTGTGGGGGSSGGGAVTIADNADVALGALGDTAWGGSGNGSVIANLKAIYGKLAAALAVTQSGTWTVQPGNTQNSTPWKVDNSGQTQPTSIADNANVALGAKADAAWTGSGSASVIAVLKSLYIAPGQATKSASVPVVLASDQDTLPTSAVLGTTNGWTPLLANALSTTLKAIKSSAGQMGMLQCWNPNATVVYIQIFNVASGSVTLGTTTPTLSIPIAPTGTGGFALSNPGVNFSTAMSMAATTTATGSTAPGTAADCNALWH